MPYVPRANAEDEPHPALTADELQALEDLEDEVEGESDIVEVETKLYGTKEPEVSTGYTVTTKSEKPAKVTFKGS